MSDKKNFSKRKKQHQNAYKVYHPSCDEWVVESNDGEKRTMRLRTDYESKTHYVIVDDKIVDSLDYSCFNVLEIEEMDKINHYIMSSIIETVFRNNN